MHTLFRLGVVALATALLITLLSCESWDPQREIPEISFSLTEQTDTLPDTASLFVGDSLFLFGETKNSNLIDSVVFITTDTLGSVVSSFAVKGTSLHEFTREEMLSHPMTKAGIYYLTVIIYHSRGKDINLGEIVMVNVQGVAPKVSPTLSTTGVALRDSSYSLTATLLAGTTPVSYQWYRDTVALPGETNLTVTISKLTYAHTGYYTLVGTNAFGHDTTIATHLIVPVNEAPLISGLTGQTINEGESFTPIALDDHVLDAESEKSTLQWKVSSKGAISASIDSLTRMLTIATPSSTWSGVDTLLLQVSDGVDSAQLSLVYTVKHVNQAPVLTTLPNESTKEGMAFKVIDLNAYVTDRESADSLLTWTIASHRCVVVKDAQNQAKISFPDSLWNSFDTLVDTVTFTVSDGEKSVLKSAIFTATSTGVTPRITDSSDSPIVGIIKRTLDEDAVARIQFKVVTNNHDSISVTYKAPEGLVDTLTFDKDREIYELKIHPQFSLATLASPTINGLMAQIYVANKAQSYRKASMTITVDVKNVNRAPIISHFSIGNIGVGNDVVGKMVYTDPDGDELIVDYGHKAFAMLNDTTFGGRFPMQTPLGMLTGIARVSDGNLEATWGWNTQIITHQWIRLSNPIVTNALNYELEGNYLYTLSSDASGHIINTYDISSTLSTSETTRLITLLDTKNYTSNNGFQVLGEYCYLNTAQIFPRHGPENNSWRILSSKSLDVLDTLPENTRYEGMLAPYGDGSGYYQVINRDTQFVVINAMGDTLKKTGINGQTSLPLVATPSGNTLFLQVNDTTFIYEQQKWGTISNVALRNFEVAAETSSELIVYAHGTGTKENQLYRYNRFNNSFNAIGAPFAFAIQAIVAIDQQVLYVLLSDHSLYLSVDGGKSFSNCDLRTVSGSLVSVISLEKNSVGSRIICVGDDGIVYRF